MIGFGCQGKTKLPILHSIEGKDNVIVAGGQTDTDSGLLVIDSETGEIWEWEWVGDVLPDDFSPAADFALSSEPQVLSFSGNSRESESGKGYLLTMDGSVEESPLQNLYFGHSWSPNGEQVVTSSRRGSTNSNLDIFIQNRDGTEFQRLMALDTSDENPDWSPAGDEIVFESYDFRDSSSTINKISLNNMELTNLTEDFGLDNRMPQWSPDASKIAFLHANAVQEPLSLWVMDKDGTNRVPVFELPESGSSTMKGVSGFSWSPDGSQLVFVSGHEGLCLTVDTMDASGLLICDEFIYLINVDGSNLIKLNQRPLTGGVTDMAWIP